MLFYHSKEEVRYTAAVQLPTKQEIGSMVSKSQDYIQMGFGISFVHPKDNFNKRLGRSIAGQRVNNYLFSLKEICIQSGRTSYAMSAPAKHHVLGDVEIVVTFSTVAQCQNVHLESVRLSHLEVL